MNDTPREVQDLYEGMLMSRSSGERLQMATRMFQTAKTLVRAGIRRDFGDLPPAELRKQIFLRFYGDDFDDEQKARIIEHLVRVTRP